MPASSCYQNPVVFLLILTLCGLWVAALPAGAQSVSSRGKVGDTELHWAAYRGHAGIVQRLLREGANVNQRVDNGSSPLHLAAYKGHRDVAAVLIENGADVNARNREGIRPLDWARSNEHADTEALLLDRGAVVGKVLPVKSKAQRASIAGAVGGNPGQYLLSDSGQYRTRPVRNSRPETREQDAFVETPIQPEQIDKLESVEQINAIMAKHRADTAAEPAAPAEPTAEVAVDTEATAPVAALAGETTEETVPDVADDPPSPADTSAGGFRVQFVALSDADRAATVRAQYSARYADILGAIDLVVESDTVGDRTLHRLRTAGLGEREAARVCDAFRARDVDCILVSPEGF